MDEVREKMERAVATQFAFPVSKRTRCPRLATMARYIEEHLGFQTEIKRGYCNTDRKPRGSRIITSPGKGRRGNRLIVRDASGEVILDHNAAETYRYNVEVAEWILGMEAA